MKIETIIPLMLASWIGVGAGVFLTCKNMWTNAPIAGKPSENVLHTLSFLISESDAEQRHVVALSSLLKDSDFSSENKKPIAQLMIWPTLTCLRHARTVNGPAYDDILKHYPFETTVRKNLAFNADVALRCIGNYIDVLARPREVSEDTWDMLKQAVVELDSADTKIDVKHD